MIYGDIQGVEFKQARYYRIGRNGCSILWAVLHTAECAETPGAAEGLEAYAQMEMPPNKEVSWTYAVDQNSITQSVREKDTAFHATLLNSYSIGIETAGRAEQTVQQWHDDASNAILDKTAELIAGICKRHGLPVRYVTDEQLRAAFTPVVSHDELGKPVSSLALRAATAVQDFGGIVFHSQVKTALHNGTHFDPGPNFPADEFLLKCQSYALEQANS